MRMTAKGALSTSLLLSLFPSPPGPLDKSCSRGSFGLFAFGCAKMRMTAKGALSTSLLPPFFPSPPGPLEKSHWCGSFGLFARGCAKMRMTGRAFSPSLTFVLFFLRSKNPFDSSLGLGPPVPLSTWQVQFSPSRREEGDTLQTANAGHATGVASSAREYAADVGITPKWIHGVFVEADLGNHVGRLEEVPEVER
jgi:hypothetical protein